MGVRTEVRFPLHELECRGVAAFSIARSSTCNATAESCMAPSLLPVCWLSQVSQAVHRRPTDRKANLENMKSRLVLVTGSEPEAQAPLGALVSESGYEPVLARSLDEALNELGQRRFLLTFLDVGPDAPELLRRLKTN